MTVQVTLTFNSIEAAIAALRDIPTSSVGEAPVEKAAPAPKPAAAAKAASGQATAKAAAAPAKTADAPSPAAQSAETAASASTAATTDPKPAAAPSAPEAAAAPTASSKEPVPFDYATLQRAVFQLANKSREAAGEVAAAFGVKTFKELPADKWEAAHAAVTAKLAELEVA